MYLFDVPVLSALLAAASSVVIGSLWYSRLLFGSLWMHYTQLSPEAAAAQRSRMPVLVPLAFLAAFAMSLAVGWVLHQLAIFRVPDALLLAVIFWVGFTIPPLLSPVLWEGKSPVVFVINSSYWLVSIAIAAILMTL